MNEIYKSSDNKGYVYLLKPKQNTNVYKVGATVNLEQRLINLQKRYGFDVEYAGYFLVDNPFAVEAQMHFLLSDCRLSGEWFILSNSQVEDILSRRVI